MHAHDWQTNPGGVFFLHSGLGLRAQVPVGTVPTYDVVDVFTNNFRFALGLANAHVDTSVYVHTYIHSSIAWTKESTCGYTDWHSYACLACCQRHHLHLCFQQTIDWRWRVQWLEEKGRCDDAAVAFMACGKLADAQRCYQFAGSWQMAFALALRANQPPASLRKMALTMIEQLIQMGRSEDAGQVAATYLQVPSINILRASVLTFPEHCYQRRRHLVWFQQRFNEMLLRNSSCRDVDNNTPQSAQHEPEPVISIAQSSTCVLE